MRSSGSGVVLTGIDPAPALAPGPVEANRVSRFYGSLQALDHVSITLSYGVTVLLGRNGAGKTTLCRVLVGLEEQDSGSVLRDGRVARSAPERRRQHAETGWLPQNFPVPKSMTVTQYLRYAAWLKGAGARRQDVLVGEALERTDLVALRKRRLGQLSGGMLRRVGIAQAIVHQPSVLVLDEPSVGLDPEQRDWFHHTIADLGRDRVVLLSTHLLEDVSALAERVIVLDHGRVRFDDRAEALAADGQVDPDSLRRGFLAVLHGGSR